MTSSLLAVFVVLGFLFLLGVARRRLSERQQTVIWVLFTVLFFCLCNALVRDVRATDGTAPSLIDADLAGAEK